MTKVEVRQVTQLNEILNVVIILRIYRELYAISFSSNRTFTEVISIDVHTYNKGYV